MTGLYLLLAVWFGMDFSWLNSLNAMFVFFWSVMIQNIARLDNFKKRIFGSNVWNSHIKVEIIIIYPIFYWTTVKILLTCVKVLCFEFFQAWTSIGYSIISYLKIEIQTNFRWYGHLIQTTYEPITFTSPTISPIIIDLLIEIILDNK